MHVREALGAPSNQPRTCPLLLPCVQVLGAYVGLLRCQGPLMPFLPGRVDAAGPNKENMLPGVTENRTVGGTRLQGAPRPLCMRNQRCKQTHTHTVACPQTRMPANT
jgi:hypothetical protein